MQFGIRTLDEVSVRGKTVLCRIDINQPVDRCNGMLKSINRIKACVPTVRELSEKGVGSDVIDMAYEELEEVPDQYETARKIAMEMIRDMDMEEMEYDEKRRIKARIGRRLAGRGFPSDVIYKVLDSLR